MTLNCILEGCKRIRSARGLCVRHYRYTRLKEKAGLTTWAEEEAAGRALAPQKSSWGRNFTIHPPKAPQ